MTKWPVQKPTHRTTRKHVEHQDATDIQRIVGLPYSSYRTLLLHVIGLNKWFYACVTDILLSLFLKIHSL